MTSEKLNEAVKEWFTTKNMQTLDPKDQTLKLIEELGELAAGISRSNKEMVMDAIGDIQVVMVGLSLQTETELRCGEEFSILGAFLDAWSCVLTGAVQVCDFVLEGKYATEGEKYEMSEFADLTLVGLEKVAKEYGTDLHECLELAYNEIKDRKGMVINGVFVKEADFPKLSEDIKKEYGIV